jgi:hypothetical protein
MTKVKMIATGSHCYNGVWLKNGDPFETDCERDADELRAIGFARRADFYQVRELTPDIGAVEPQRAKRTYTRRDLTAQP